MLGRVVVAGGYRLVFWAKALLVTVLAVLPALEQLSDLAEAAATLDGGVLLVLARAKALAAN